MAEKQRPEVVVNFNAFLDGIALGGVSSVVLPSLEPLSVEIKGASIMGSYNTYVDGHYSPLTTTINFYAPFEGARRLRSGQYVGGLDLRIAEQMYDVTSNTKVIRADKLLIGGQVSKTDLGTIESVVQAAGSLDIDTTILGVWLNGEELFYIDKLNYIYRGVGTGLLGDMLRAIGM